MSHEIQVAQIIPRSLVNGPGERFVVWVQGCYQRCPDCFNPSFLAFDDQLEHVRSMASAEVMEMFNEEARRRPLEGITFSGGEPFAQANALAVLAKEIQALGLNVAVFTGYNYPWVARMAETPPGADMADLLAAADLLVAGPYRKGEHLDDGGLRGSANQKLVVLSDRISLSGVPKSRVEFQVHGDGTVLLTGLPSEEARGHLANLGLELVTPDE